MGSGLLAAAPDEKSWIKTSVARMVMPAIPLVVIDSFLSPVWHKTQNGTCRWGGRTMIYRPIIIRIAQAFAPPEPINKSVPFFLCPLFPGGAVEIGDGFQVVVDGWRNGLSQSSWAEMVN
jgi:hypothetical protein